MITGFTSNGSKESQQITYGTPENHVWEVLGPTIGGAVYVYNKVTGEIYYMKVDKKQYPDN